jgi:hypothetical protein
MFLEDQIGVICDLSHLHDQTENVGVVVKHHTSADVGIKLARSVGHDTPGEIMFDLAEELVVDGDAGGGNYTLASNDQVG